MSAGVADMGNAASTSAGSGSMVQTLLVVVLFVVAMALLPWLLRRLKQRQSVLGGASAAPARVLTAVSLGPQQRLVTVEVGSGDARTCLVLGVTAQQITCLHVLPAPASAPAPAAAFATAAAVANAGTLPPSTSFSQAMARMQAGAAGAPNHG